MTFHQFGMSKSLPFDFVQTLTIWNGPMLLSNTLLGLVHLIFS